MDIRLSNQSGVFTFVHVVFSLSVPLSVFFILPFTSPQPLLRCFHGNSRERSDWPASISPQNCGVAAEIANQPLKSAGGEGGDCMNIF